MGRSCCVINCTNKSHDYKGVLLNNGLSFHRFPGVKTHQGSEVHLLTTRRRRAWVAAVRRVNITFEHIPSSMSVCSRHFHGGCPTYEQFDASPDWAPSLHLGHKETKQTTTERHRRHTERAEMRKTADAKLQEERVAVEEVVEEAEGRAIDSDGTGTAQDSEDYSKEVQTEISITLNLVDSMQHEVNRLLEENRELTKKLADKELTRGCLEGDDDKVRYYTGLASFSTFITLLNHLAPYLPQASRQLLSPFQMLFLVFLRLRLDLPIQHIAYLFGMHRTTAANYFMDTVSVMHRRLSPLIHWPDRDSLRKSMPHQFVEVYGKRVAVIVDCFEIFIERPSNLKARSQTFSHYKHNNTMKYLIGITPQGSISFISKGWGGRTSDKHVTENCGFLDNLLPGDIVLADRGFDIDEMVGMMCAEVKIPSFTRGRSQMCARDIESTRELAHLRIHVERVIGNLCAKYTVLTGTLPICLVLPCESEGITFLDKMVTLCCALTNMCPSVV